ncbi:MAG: hypothetical protein WD766_01725 [Gemmatimonadota bacterium]
MHHLILVREIDQQMSGSGCCGRIEGDAAAWGSGGCVFPERREKMTRVGEVYRAVREEFGDRVEITIVDPRNFISFLPLVVRDAVRFHVPLGTALRAMASTSLSTGVFDGQILFERTLPTPPEVVELITKRLEIHHVGTG